MPTLKELAIIALRRTGNVVVHSASGIPADRWDEWIAEGTNSSREIMRHLIECERWWLENIGVPESERPPLPDFERVRTKDESIRAFESARKHLLSVVAELPDAFFEKPVPACRYEDFHSGADLMHYMAEHTNYHDGQMQMLEMAYAPP